VNESAKVADSEDSVPKPLAGIRILHVTPNHPNSNIRMRKENLSYQRAGATCSALILGHRRDNELISDVQGVKVIEPRLPRFHALVSKISVETRLNSRAHRRAIAAAIMSERPHVLHVHDMFVGGSAIRVARNRSPKVLSVVLDLHENFPAAVEVYRTAYPPLKRLAFAIFQGRRRMSLLERRMMASVDLVLTVTEEATDRIAPLCPATPIVTVPNLDHRPGTNSRVPDFSSRPAGPLRMTYVGTIQIHRGLQTVVRALSQLPPGTATLDIFGAKDDDFTTWLRQETIRLKLAETVTLHGWLPLEEINIRIGEADLAIVPHESTDQTNATLPHKLFEYMTQARPVLVSSCPPIAKHVRAADSGFVFAAGDEVDCARAITEALDRRDDFQRLGENGRRYVTEEMNWELVSEPALIPAVAELSTRSRRAGAPSTSSVEA